MSKFRHSKCDCKIEMSSGLVDQSVGDHTLMVAGALTKSVMESGTVEKFTCGAMRVTAIIVSAYQVAMAIGMTDEELNECADIALNIHRAASESFSRGQGGVN